jgi:hypothetical protein
MGLGFRDCFYKEPKQIGYQKNSYEKKAREAANRWDKACLQEMKQRGLLK